jgi:hypothetical protein
MSPLAIDTDARKPLSCPSCGATLLDRTTRGRFYDRTYQVCIRAMGPDPRCHHARLIGRSKRRPVIRRRIK